MATPYVRPKARTGPTLESFDVDTFLVVDSITFHATVEESHEKSATITDHPIEEGAVVSDHVQREPDRYSATLLVTNTPLDITPESLLVDPDRVAATDDAISRTMDAGRPVQVIGAFRRYPQMLIESYTVGRNAQNGQALFAQLSLRAFQTVQAEETAIPPAIASPPKKVDAAPAVDGGTQTGTQTSIEAELEAEAAAIDKSIAAGLFDRAGNFGGF